MSFFMEEYLAVDESWMKNFIAAPKTASKEDRPQTQLVAANDLTQSDLRWYYGISSEKINGKLVAIIPISGVMSKGWDWRGVSTEWVRRQIQVAADNVNVVGIVLSMDTPGGTVNGTAALAKEVANAKVTVIAHTDFMCASAGIWVSSMAKEHWISSSKTTGLGSIGVIWTIMSMAEYNKKQGLDFRVLRSKGSENKSLLHPMEPIDEKALAKDQKLIDDMRVEMLADIRSGRPQISADIDGEMYYGQEAIKVGLADKVGSLEDAVKRAFFLGIGKS